MVLVTLLVKFGFHTLAAAKPSASTGDLHLDYTLGFEILVATVLSWWPYMGGVMRMSRSCKQAMWPSMICLGMITGVVGLIGLYAGLVNGDPDPSVFFVKTLGVWMGIVAHHLHRAGQHRHRHRRRLCLGHRSQADPGAAVPADLQVDDADRARSRVIVCAFLQDPVHEPRQHVHVLPGPDLRADLRGADRRLLRLPQEQPPPAVALRLLRRRAATTSGAASTRPPSWPRPSGFFLYWYLLNPLTYASHFPFKWISASVPCVIVSGVVYWVLTKYWIMRAGKGGYEQA